MGWWLGECSDGFSFVVVTLRGSTNLAGWEIPTIWVDVSPIQNGSFPASYVSLPEGIVVGMLFGLGWFLCNIYIYHV